MIPLLKDLVLVQVAEWYDLGLQLGVEDEELDVIKKNNPGNLRACKREMFRKWLRITPSPSYQHLVEALIAVGDVKEADQLSKKYGKEIPACGSSLIDTNWKLETFGEHCQLEYPVNFQMLVFPCRNSNPFLKVNFESWCNLILDFHIISMLTLRVPICKTVSCCSLHQILASPCSYLAMVLTCI